MEKKKRVRKRNKGSAKGAKFERDLCIQLSEWWSYGKRDDIFWRTGGSGARATVRHRAGKETRGQHGDIGLSDPVGKPLLDVLTFSLKCGYKSISIQDLFDMPRRNKTREIELWLEEAHLSSAASQSCTFALVIKRDHRDAIIIAPLHFFRRIGGGELAVIHHTKRIGECKSYGIQRLSWFFQITPEEIKRIAEEHD